MNIEKIEKLALEVAAKSPCKKRKVGAVIVDEDGNALAAGTNFNADTDKPCEDGGVTNANVVHAEVAAIDTLYNMYTQNAAAVPKAHTIFVTHQPCENCAAAIKGAGIPNTHIVDSFMKFDKGKLRYSLVPPEATKAIAEVLTYGAKKYKPNNWKQAKDTDRYVDALYRHLEAWRAGEKNDEESGLQHLAHALTNISFLIHFENQ